MTGEAIRSGLPLLHRSRKYFASASSHGLMEAFYASFLPTIQRTETFHWCGGRPSWGTDTSKLANGSVDGRSWRWERYGKMIKMLNLLEVWEQEVFKTLLYESWAQRWFIIKVAGHRWLLAWQNFKLNALRKRVPLVYDWLLLNSTDWWFQSFFIFNIFQIIYYIINYIYKSMYIWNDDPKKLLFRGKLHRNHPSFQSFSDPPEPSQKMARFCGRKVYSGEGSSLE